jgi:hypothetical protein
MVAVIHTPNSLRIALNYNEQKVKEKKAVCIAAHNYPKDLNQLNFYNKLNRLVNQAALNQNVKRNAVHISLNFDPSEKFGHQALEKIANSYMQKIGFGNQPYLVYEHKDAGHPHIHILTTNIQANGKRIELHNIGRDQSEKARKKIEVEFNLVSANRKQKHAYDVKPVNARKVQYGKSETKRSITNVLDAVINTYKYTSLAELNAVLKLYNVVADRGAEDSRTFQKNGLVYRILDENGTKVGVPIKASLFYSKPTLANLEKKFEQNESARLEHKKRIKVLIDWHFMKQPRTTLDNIITALAKEGIHTVLRQNQSGLIYGITFIDHQTKCVFNGSDLGKQYSATSLQERCANGAITDAKQIDKRQELKYSDDIVELPSKAATPDYKLLHELIKPEEQINFVPYQMKKKRKKRTRTNKI